MDTKQTAQTFLEKHTRLREISEIVTPMESTHLAVGGLGSAGMEAMGVLDEYTELSRERGEIVDELKRIRSEVGDEAIVAELEGMEGGDKALEYIEKTSPRENREKEGVRKETRKGFFGRFR